MLKMANDDRSFFKRFVDNVEDGYKSQDEAIKKEKDAMTTGERLAEGAVNGVTDAAMNPVRWLRSIFN